LSARQSQGEPKVAPANAEKRLKSQLLKDFRKGLTRPFEYTVAKGVIEIMRLTVWATPAPLAGGCVFPQLAKLTALHCRALNDSLAVHLKQKHFCEGFVPKHTFIDLGSFRPSIRSVTVIIPSRTAKLPKISVPLASRKLIFFGHR
jgi:hypothetical protein